MQCAGRRFLQLCLLYSLFFQRTRYFVTHRDSILPMLAEMVLARGLDTSDQAPGLRAAIIVMLVVATFFVVLRFCARYRSALSYGWDDWMILVSLVRSSFPLDWRSRKLILPLRRAFASSRAVSTMLVRLRFPLVQRIKSS
jgi:hypothetical protein